LAPDQFRLCLEWIINVFQPRGCVCGG
jgi:hypothetical protein